MSSKTTISPKRKHAQLWMNIGRAVAWVFIGLLLLVYSYTAIFTYSYGDGQLFNSFITNPNNYIVMVICAISIILLIKKPFVSLIYVSIFELVVIFTAVSDAIRKDVHYIYPITAVLLLGLLLMIVGAINAYKYKHAL